MSDEMEEMGEESEEMEKESDGKVDKYELKCAVEHVMKAEEIKADKKMWPLVKKELEAKGVAIKKAIRSFKDLKEVAYEKTKV